MVSYPLVIARRHEVWIEQHALGHAMGSAECLFATAGAAFAALRDDVPGAMVECGVAGGAHPAVMHYCMRWMGKYRPIYLFDSFQGVPKPTEGDLPASNDGLDVRDTMFSDREMVLPGVIESSGWYQTSEEDTRKLLMKTGALAKDIHLVPGWFQDTLSSTDTGAISLLRLDADVYESTRVCVEQLYPRVSAGGYVMAHDWHLAGVRNAVRDGLEFMPEISFVPERTCTGHTAYWRKP